MLEKNQNIISHGGWEKVNGNFNIPQQFPRFGHSIVMYKNSLFIYGGLPAQQLMEQIRPQVKDLFYKNVVKFNLINRQSTSNQINQANLNNFKQSFIGIIDHSAIVFGNQMYIFGGSNNNFSRTYRQPQMWSVNLQTFSIRKHQTKGNPPKMRIKTLMTVINKGYILLYGGQFCSQLLCDFHLYKFQTKTWFTPTDHHQFQLPALRMPSLTSMHDDGTVYLFGGQQQIADNQQTQSTSFLKTNNFYQLKIVQKSTSPKPDIIVKKIYCSQSPDPRVGHKIMNFMDKYFVLVGGQNLRPEQKRSLWIYNPIHVSWIKIDPKGVQFTNQSQQLQYFCSYQKIIVFGGSKNQIKNQILFLNLDIKSLQIEINNNMKYNKQVYCQQCHQNNIKLFPIPQKILSSQIQQYLQQITFPFQAIALFIDNSLLTNSQLCTLSFGQWKNSTKSNHKDKYILIQDIGQTQPIWGSKYENFMKQIINFGGNTLDKDFNEDDLKQNAQKTLKQIKQKQKKVKKQWQQKLNSKNVPPLDAPKKTQKDFEKQKQQLQQRKQKLQMKSRYFLMQRNRKVYNNNLKIGGLRLGNTLLYQSKQKFYKNDNIEKEIRRVLLIQKINIQNQQYYGFYSYVLQNNVLTNPQMQYAMKYINQQYKKQRKLFPNQKNNFNCVYISDLKQLEGQFCNVPQLQFMVQKNDIYYGDKQLISKYQKSNIDFTQCCDVSLKAFISVLYLKNQMRITINVKNQPQLIQSQPFLPDIVNIQRDKDLIDLQQCFDFDCNIVEMYLNPSAKINKGKPYLHNGVLLYHKNRLISRYKYNLGQLLQQIDQKQQPIKNLPQIFGYLQLAQNFNVNTFKTAFMCQSALQKYFSRIKFVNEYYHKLLLQKNI